MGTSLSSHSAVSGSYLRPCTAAASLVDGQLPHTPPRGSEGQRPPSREREPPSLYSSWAGTTGPIAPEPTQVQPPWVLLWACTNPAVHALACTNEPIPTEPAPYKQLMHSFT